jgi:8-oxo-dGTP pyrophosphatase MutT (NUDIX family)
MVALQREDEQVLLTKRRDTGAWCLPAGAAEEGGSFTATAVSELAEETGVEVSPADLVPFGCLSEAALHTIRYPNGDLTHCFAMCFLARRWRGEPRADLDETTEVRFADLSRPPEPLDSPARQALGLLQAFLADGKFQLR